MDIANELKSDPESFFHLPCSRTFGLPLDELNDLQLTVIRQRFSALKEKIPVLKRLADEQGVDSIESIDDAVPLLFPHTVYKSYPISYLEKNRFGKLTRWLEKLTTTDLAGVNAEGIEFIDDWIQALEDGSNLKVSTSSGTSGKLSVIPRTKKMWPLKAMTFANYIQHWLGEDSGPDMLSEEIPYLQLNYRHGNSTTLRVIEACVETYACGEENSMLLYPGERASADVISIIGRMKTAAGKGQQEYILSPALEERKNAQLKIEAGRSESILKFFIDAQSKYQGDRVCLAAIWPFLYDATMVAKENGMRNLFAADSILLTGGGNKDRELPDNWQEDVFEFLGFDNYFEVYGMSEITAVSPRCKYGNYHFAPVTVPFLLDPQRGQPLPRTGTQTGRLGTFDMTIDNYWAGVISGDEVTMHWDSTCACGLSGPHVSTIRRYSEKQSGDDKINCAGVADAMDQAIAQSGLAE